ncbi:Hypothetical predicted protein, partial [Cloeon dipterum]
MDFDDDDIFDTIQAEAFQDLSEDENSSSDDEQQNKLVDNALNVNSPDETPQVAQTAPALLAEANYGIATVPNTEEALPTENTYVQADVESCDTFRLPLQEKGLNEANQDPKLQAEIPRSIKDRIQDLQDQLLKHNVETKNHLNEIDKKQKDQEATITRNYHIVKSIEAARSTVEEKMRKEQKLLNEEEERKKSCDSAEDELKILQMEKEKILKTIEDKRNIISNYKKFHDPGRQQRVKQYQDEIKSKKEKLDEMRENKSYVEDLNQSLEKNEDEYKKLKARAIAQQKEDNERMENQLEALKKELNATTKPAKRPVSILSLCHPMHQKRPKLTDDSTENLAIPSTSRAADVRDAEDENSVDSAPNKFKKNIEAQTYKEQIGHLRMLTAINSAIRIHAGLSHKDEKYKKLEANVKTISAVRKCKDAAVKKAMIFLKKQEKIKGKDLDAAAQKFLENMEIKPREGFEEVDENINMFAMKLASAHSKICSLFRLVAHRVKNKLPNLEFEEFSEYCKQDSQNQPGKAPASHQVTEIYEIWHYEKTTKYKKDEDEGLFTSFVNAFLKLKQEASGWPENNMSNEDKKKYIESYAIEESIDLDENKIEKNEVIRTVAKLCLNSLWGKFGQNVRSKTAVIEDRSRLLELLSAPNVTVTNIMCDATSKVVVQYNDDQDTLNNVNALVAALTTSHARIMLYQLLHIL